MLGTASRSGAQTIDRRSRSPIKKPELRRRAASANRRRRTSLDDGRQVTHAFKEFVAHGSNVNCLSLGQKSGRVLVTGGDDKKVNLWAVGKPNCILSLAGHTTAVECVRFGGTEELVCAGSQSGALKIWDLEATKIVRTLTGHKANIRGIDFHPYGDFIATGSFDTNIKLWDIRRKGCIFTYKGHNMQVNNLKFSPDGQWIASAGEDCLVKLWDLRAGKLLTEFGGHGGPVNDVEFHPNEFLLASASCDRTVNFWDLEKFSLVSTTETDIGTIRTVAFHPEGDCLYAGSPDVLKVYGWEPARTYDTVAMGWGKIQDIAIAQNQLIGAGYHGVNVSLYVVDLKRVQPFGGQQQDIPNTTSFRYGTAIRKSFSKDKNNGKANMDSIKTEEASDTGGDEPPEEDPPPIISNLNDYEDIFRTHRELQRTPPPREPKSSSNNNDAMVPQILKNPDLVRPEPQRSAPSSMSTPKSPSTPEAPRRSSATGVSLLPRPVAISKQDSNSNVPQMSLAVSGSQDRRGSSQDLSYGSPHRDVPCSTSPSHSQSNSQSYRARAVSESRRDQPPHNEQENRYYIKHSPSEPYLVRQSSSPGPGNGQPPGYFPEHPGLPQLARPDITNLTRIQASSKPDLTSHTKPIDRPTLARPSYRGSNPDVTQSKQNQNHEITYMGSPKDPSEYQYKSEKLKDHKDYISSYSPGLSLDKSVNFDDFLPNKMSGLGMGNSMDPNFAGMTGMTGTEMSEQEVVSSMVRGHSSLMSVMLRRTRGLQVTHKIWQTKDLRTAIEHALNTGDQALLIDVLAIINLRPSIWNLDILQTLLPHVSLLLQSKYEVYITCACDALKLMLKNFATIIKSNMQGPIHSVGVDISREERYNKCLECYNHMMSIRAFLLKRQTVQGKMGHTYRELVILMQAFD